MQVGAQINAEREKWRLAWTFSLSLGVPFSGADDVAQNALLRAWQSIEQLESSAPEQMCSWLDMIARNAATDFARQIIRRQTDELTENILDTSDMAGITVMRQILDGALEAIHALPAHLRYPLLLSVVSELTAVEIAKKLGSTQAAIRQRVTRARRSLSARKYSGMSADA